MEVMSANISEKKIDVQYAMRSPWTSCQHCTKLCLYCFKKRKRNSSTEHLGCNTETFKKHIEQQFTEGMSWENYGKWHIDHRIPLKYNKPSLEEVVKRLHYTNTHPMWASENISKGCRYISG